MIRIGRRGFTLIEVIVAMAILGIGLLSLLFAFPGAVKSSVRSEYNSRAPLMAQQIMETFKVDNSGFPFVDGMVIPEALNGQYPKVPIVECIDDDDDGDFDEDGDDKDGEDKVFFEFA